MKICKICPNPVAKGKSKYCSKSCFYRWDNQQKKSRKTIKPKNNVYLTLSARWELLLRAKPELKPLMVRIEQRLPL